MKEFGLTALICLFVLMPGGFLGIWIGPTIAVDILGFDPNGWGTRQYPFRIDDVNLFQAVGAFIGITPAVLLLEYVEIPKK